MGLVIPNNFELLSRSFYSELKSFCFLNRHPRLSWINYQISIITSTQGAHQPFLRFVSQAKASTSLLWNSARTCALLCPQSHHSYLCHVLMSQCFCHVSTTVATHDSDAGSGTLSSYVLHPSKCPKPDTHSPINHRTESQQTQPNANEKEDPYMESITWFSDWRSPQLQNEHSLGYRLAAFSEPVSVCAMPCTPAPSATTARWPEPMCRRVLDPGGWYALSHGSASNWTTGQRSVCTAAARLTVPRWYNTPADTPPANRCQLHADADGQNRRMFACWEWLLGRIPDRQVLT